MEEPIEVGPGGAVTLALLCGGLGEAAPARRPAVPAAPRGRSRTISMKRVSKREQARARMEVGGYEYERPEQRADCLHGAFAVRPCPYVACKFHLYLEVNPRTGSIRMNFLDKEPWELNETCALDVADRGGVTLEEVGGWLNLTRERVRQLEVHALGMLRGVSEAADLMDLCG
ncbi:MAG: DNA-binding protein AsgB [Myxococcaceae bacterium]|nr:DNA-binding protein AsgB [Myxococcaceae bacterium]